MPLFKKKPSMQEQRAALGLIPGSPVPLNQYAQVLRDTLNTVAKYRISSDVAESMGIDLESIKPEQRRVLYDMVMQEYASLSQAVRQLQEIRPDVPHLLDVHVAATTYLEKYMLLEDRFNRGLRLELQGDRQTARQVYEDAARRQPDILKARKLFAAELRRLNGKDKTLYASLAIPYAIRDTLDVP